MYMYMYMYVYIYIYIYTYIYIYIRAPRTNAGQVKGRCGVVAVCCGSGWVRWGWECCGLGWERCACGLD